MSPTELGVASAKVAAVVWTYNRYAVLKAALAAIECQERQPDLVIVVDSDSPDETALRCREEFVDAVVVKLESNDGVGAAAAAGIAEALRRGAEWIWLIEDDTIYPPWCLGGILDAVERHQLAGEPILMLGWQGLKVKWGRWRSHCPTADERVSSVLLDGSLIHRRLVEEIGLPRDDFFMMIDDVEYGLRASRHGLPVWVSEAARGDAGKLGAATNPLWRNYYQTRNHLRMVLAFRSPTLGLGLLLRLAHQLLLCGLKGRRGRQEAALRFHGLWDAVTGRMGRTLDPASDRWRYQAPQV